MTEFDDLHTFKAFNYGGFSATPTCQTWFLEFDVDKSGDTTYVLDVVNMVARGNKKPLHFYIREEGGYIEVRSDKTHYKIEWLDH